MDARRPPRPNESSLSEPNPTEFFICSTYLSGTPRSSCLFSPALLSMMNLRWPQKLRNGTDIGVLSAGAEDKTSEGGERERERQPGFGRRTVREMPRRVGRVTKKGNGEVQRPRRLHFHSCMSFVARDLSNKSAKQAFPSFLRKYVD